ncbi:MAG: radical SAM protein [Coriobacteriia bacterium]|nr:radical SAM protein [Coriobacteriia bacterium]
MANLSITRRCERDCAFCFAAEERRREPLDMSAETFERAMDLLERSGIPDARLLGGEPTLHPDFASLSDRALERGFALTVMTGGLVPDDVLAYLASLPTDHMTVFLNAATPGVDGDSLVGAQEHVCKTLGECVELGVTIVSADTDQSFLLEIIERHGLRRSVRIGVAHPIVGGANASVPTRDLRGVGVSIEAFVTQAEAHGVSVGFDCGITPCMFSEEFAAAHPDVIESVGTRCGPIVDVLPEGDAIACYALASLVRLPLDGYATRRELIATFTEALGDGPPWIFEECAECTHRAAGRCTGGCRARRMNGGA